MIAGKRVMRQSLFAGQLEAKIVPKAKVILASRLATYALPSVALLVALIALAVALLK